MEKIYKCIGCKKEYIGEVIDATLSHANKVLDDNVGKICDDCLPGYIEFCKQKYYAIFLSLVLNNVNGNNPRVPTAILYKVYPQLIV
jgi:hypothetical protein